MINLAHEEVLLLLALLAFGNVLNRAAEAHDAALRPRALKISKPMGLHPADLAVSPPNPILMVEVRLQIGRIERRLTEGQKLLGYADRLLRLAEEAVSEMRTGKPKGVFRLGSLESTAGSRLPAL